MRSLAVVSILAVLTTSAMVLESPAEAAVRSPSSPVILAAAALESSTRVVPSPEGKSTSLLTTPGPSSSSTQPASLPTAVTSSTTSSPTTPVPEPTTSSTVSTTTTIADLTREAIEVMRLPKEVVIEYGGTVAVSLGIGGQLDGPPTREVCIRQAKTSPLQIDGVYDRNLIAQMTHEVFECLTSVAGLDAVAPTALRRWNGAGRWGFESLAEQLASEAVVVAYCESEGFEPRWLTGSNPFGYAGLFQMGSVEIKRFGEPGASRFDPVDSAVGAANYFLFQYRNGAGWGGWSPWAVVNTNFNDEINDRVKIPVLPRFVSTDPEFRGRPGPELPQWAVDPWAWTVPHWDATGCPYTGGRWPAASPRTQG